MIKYGINFSVPETCVKCLLANVGKCVLALTSKAFLEVICGEASKYNFELIL